MGDDSKARENKNVYLWVAKESEEMLVEDWVASSSRVKESGV